MTEHQAVLAAQRRLKPVKQQWSVDYYENGKWNTKLCKSEEEANTFFYKQFSKYKNEAMNTKEGLER